MMMIYFLTYVLLAEEVCTEGEVCANAEVGEVHFDKVLKVPGWGDEYTGAMYSGYVHIDPDCHSKMFYWMLEKEGGSEPGVTPVLLWLNGGPGASSIDGLVLENIGPYTLVGENFKFNEYGWTNMYNVLVVDNPVGTGYSVTDNRTECYSQTELEVAENFYLVLLKFFERHTEYSTNPFFLTGESYAGKYIPHIAVYLDKMKFKFTGVILGNGLYEPTVQYPTVPDIAFSYGVIGHGEYQSMQKVANQCVELINQNKNDEAAEFCEGMTTAIYGGLGGGVFQYDVRSFYDYTENPYQEKWLNNVTTKLALHTVGATWTDADEEGPVAEALKSDFVLPVMEQLETLVSKGYNVTLYNGQMDGTVCNHMGNALILENLKWRGRVEFSQTRQTIWRLSDENAIGYKRVTKNLAFVIIFNAGHLVPMNQPKNYRVFLDEAVSGNLA